MDSPRLPRFKRAPEVAAMQLTQRDRKIVQLVHLHRFLRSPQILALLAEGSQVLRRLQLLFHHGFLERPRAQLDYFHEGGSRHIVYGIGNKGATLLKSELRLPLHKVHWGEKNRQVGRIFLEHALLVSDVMVAIEIACREKGRIKLLSRYGCVLKVALRQGICPSYSISRVLARPGLPQRGRPFRLVALWQER